MDVKVSFDDRISVVVRLREDDTPTKTALRPSLPFESSASRWGDEIYFEVPYHVLLEKDAREVMDVGEVAFWPDGSSLALFFGRTPMSVDDRPRAYSRCNIVGRIIDDPHKLEHVKPGARVRVSEHNPSAY